MNAFEGKGPWPELAHAVRRARARCTEGLAAHRAGGVEEGQARHARVPPKRCVMRWRARRRSCCRTVSSTSRVRITRLRRTRCCDAEGRRRAVQAAVVGKPLKDGRRLASANTGGTECVKRQTGRRPSIRGSRLIADLRHGCHLCIRRVLAASIGHGAEGRGEASAEERRGRPHATARHPAHQRP